MLEIDLPNATKDAVDVALMTDVGAIDLDDLEETVTALLGDPEERRGFFERIRDDLPNLG